LTDAASRSSTSHARPPPPPPVALPPPKKTTTVNNFTMPKSRETITQKRVCFAAKPLL
jgi:hypothetical protein